MRLFQHLEEKYRDDTFFIFWDVFWGLFFYIGAVFAVQDIKERAHFLFTAEQDRGVVVLATYDTRLVPQPRDRPTVHKIVPVVKVKYNGTMKIMDNRSKLEAGDSVTVLYSAESPEEWRPMSRFACSPLSLLFMPDKQAGTIYMYVSFWVFSCIVIFVIVMLILPKKEEKSVQDK